MNLTTYASVGGQVATDNSNASASGLQLGAKLVGRDGRTFRFVKAGAVALVKGNVIQGPAIVANHLTLTPSAAAIGATQVTVTLGATDVTENQYAGGWVVVNVTPDIGGQYLIASHPAALGSATLTLTLASDTPLLVAWTSSTRVSLIASKWNGVIASPATTLTGSIVGVATYPIPIGEYGWVQSGGPCATLTTGTPITGAAVVVPGAAAGSVTVDPADAAVRVVGAMMQPGIDATNRAVDLMIDF